MALTGRAVEKIWKITTTYVLPSVLTPSGIRQRGMALADARAHEIRAIAQAERDAERIRDGLARLDETGQLIPVPQFHGDVVPDHSLQQSQTTLTAVEEARTAADLQNLQKHINERRALAMAAKEAESIPDDRVSDKPMDADWFARWRDGAQRVSDNEMRTLWAKILAGEAVFPGSFRLRTLTTLQSLSPADARLIEEAAPFVVDGEIPREPDVTEMLPLGKLLQLAEMGVLTGVELGNLHAIRKEDDEEARKFECLLVCNNKALLVLSDNPKDELTFKCVRVTSVGREIMSLGQFQANPLFLEAFVSVVKKQGFCVSLGDYDRDNKIILNAAVR